MKSIRRAVQQIIDAIVATPNSPTEHVHLSRAYRPVSGGVVPRWRNLGTSITPYHFLRPVLVPVVRHPNRRNTQ